MMTFQKHKNSLHYDGISIYSYGTKVASRVGNDLIVERYWSNTTSRHIAYAARELGLNLVKLY